MMRHRRLVLCLGAFLLLLGAGKTRAALVAHWSLDEPAGTSGTGSVMDSTTLYHGTPSGGVTFGLPGATPNTGMAADFDGTDDVIDVPYNPVLNPESFTLTAWAFPDTGAGGFNSVVTSREDLFPDLGGYVLYNAADGAWQFWTGPGPAAGGWDVVTGPAVLTGSWQHLALTFDAATETKSLYVDGILAASEMGGYTPNASRDLHIGSGGDFGTEFRFDGLLDDVALFNEALSESEIRDIMENGIAASGPQNLVLEIDRGTGNARLTNPTLGSDFEIAGYSLLSDGGALDDGAWLSIAENYDADSGGEVDDANNWNIFTSEPGELSEGTLGAATLAPGADIDLGNVWLQSPIEDVTTEIPLAGGSVISAAVVFVGNDSAAFEVGDLNFDGVIDETDWPIYRDGYRTDLSNLSEVQAYRMGDLNFDGTNDVLDFALFKTAYEGANGAGSFAAISGGVPEPATLGLLLLAVAVLCCRATFRITRVLRVLLGTALAFLPISMAQAEPPSLVAHWPLDMDAMDVVGGHDGTPMNVNFGIEGANANTGMAGDFFEGSTIEVPYSAELNPESFTIALWAQPFVTGDGMYRSPITSRDDQFPGGGDTYGYIIYNNNVGEWSFWTGAGDGNGAWDQLGGGPVTAVEWVHLAISFDAASQSKSFYVNGELAGQSTTQTYGPVGTVEEDNLHIGSGSDLGDNFYFNGYIDDVAIFEGTLTQPEVQNIMENGVSAFELLRLTLSVNTNSGAATLTNPSGAEQVIDLYEVESPGASLNAAGWASLQDQDFEGSGGVSGTGDGWEELGSPDADLLAEGFLQGSSPLDVQTSIELGTLYDRSVGAEDLVFRYRLATGELVEGVVEYFEGPGGFIPGDFNDSGLVEQGDLDLVLGNWGADAEDVPDTWASQPPTGIVDQAELDRVLGNWGRNMPGLGAAAAVPEPSTLALTGLLVGVLVSARRRKPRVPIGRAV